MGTSRRFKQCASLRRGTILTSALVMAFCALAPTALGEPAEDQYNFNPPNPGGNGGESSSGGSDGGSFPGTSSDYTGPGSAIAALFDPKEEGGGTRASGGGDATLDAAPGVLDTVGLLEVGGSGTSPDRSFLSAVTDSAGLGLMPVVLAAIVAISIAGVSVAVYRRRRDAHGEPA